MLIGSLRDVMSSSPHCLHCSEEETEAQRVEVFAEVAELVGGGTRIQTWGPVSCPTPVTALLCAHKHTHVPSILYFCLLRLWHGLRKSQGCVGWDGGDLVSVLASRGPGKCVLGWAEKGQEGDRTTIHP